MPRMTFNIGLAEHVGRQIKQRRKTLGLSQRALGRRLAGVGGVGDGTISRYETAVHGPSLETLCLLALEFDCDPADLLPSIADLRAMFPEAKS